MNKFMIKHRKGKERGEEDILMVFKDTVSS